MMAEKLCPRSITSNCETKECLHAFGETTTLHGVRYITEPRANKLERLCWTLAILVSTILCGIQINTLYQRWKESPVITSFAQKPTPVSAIPLPAVTICPINKINRSVIDIENKLDWLTNILKKNGTHDNHDEQVLAETVKMLCAADILPPLHTEFIFSDKHRQLIYKLAPSLDDVFHVCKSGTEFYHCNYVFRPILTSEYLCFTFNLLRTDEIFKKNQEKFEIDDAHVPNSSWSQETGYLHESGNIFEHPNRETNYLGAWSGIYIGLISSKEESQKICKEPGSTEGFVVTINSPEEWPALTKRKFYMSPNTLNMVSIRPEKLEADLSLRPPQYQPEDRGCIFQEEYNGFLFRNITLENCMMEEGVNDCIKEQNCVPFHLPPFVKGVDNKDLQYCYPGCYVRNFTAMSQCLPSCHEIRYQYYLNSFNLDYQSSYNRSVGRGSTNNSVTQENEQMINNKQYTYLQIYYQDGSFFAISKSEMYGITDFIANCGGLLGLFTGFSLITLMEICYFSSVRLVCRVHEHRRKEAIQENDQSLNSKSTEI